MSRQRLARRGK